MEVFFREPKIEIQPGLNLEQGIRYVVDEISYNPLSGVMFSLVGITVAGTDRHHLFPARHFAPLQGRFAEVVSAKENTDARKIFGQHKLLLTHLCRIPGIELVRCVATTARIAPIKLFPYEQFYHW